MSDQLCECCGKLIRDREIDEALSVEEIEARLRVCYGHPIYRQSDELDEDGRDRDECIRDTAEVLQSMGFLPQSRQLLREIALDPMEDWVRDREASA